MKSELDNPVYFDEDDDLADYQDQMQEEVVNQVMAMRPLVKDDVNHLPSNRQEDGPKVKELSEEEMKARDLKLKNARKYFEMVRISYLQHLTQALKEMVDLNKDRSRIVDCYLSLLSDQLLEQFMELKSIRPTSLEVERVLKWMRRGQRCLEEEEWKIEPSDLLWALCDELGLVARKVYFFDAQALVEQRFYQLRYQMNENKRKKQAKVRKETQMIQMQLERKIEEMENDDSQQYMNINDFQFDPTSFKKQPLATKANSSSVSQNVLEVEDKDKDRFKTRRENNQLRKKHFRNAYLQIFCGVEDEWRLVNSYILEREDEQQFKKYVLEGKVVLGFTGIRKLQFSQNFASLSEVRPMKEWSIDDLTSFFADTVKQINARRKRVGLKGLLKNIMLRNQPPRYSFLLTHYQNHLQQRSLQKELQRQLQNFPTNKQDMLTHQFFTVPSMAPQYCILDDKAQSIPDVLFQEEKVYLRKDLIGVKSKLGWIDQGRQVMEGEGPVKKTENKSKNQTELYLYEQTRPYILRLTEEGNFVPDDEHNNIYIPPDWVPNEGLEIIDKKVGFVCSRAKIRHVQVVQGFNRNIGRILPNQIGFLVYSVDRENILELHQERQTKRLEAKSKNREKDLLSMWNKLFKKMELSEWSNAFSSHR